MALARTGLKIIPVPVGMTDSLLMAGSSYYRGSSIQDRDYIDTIYMRIPVMWATLPSNDPTMGGE